jgi:hypothetical protein
MRNFLLYSLLLTLFSCSQPASKTAEDFLQSAQQFRQSDDFQNAKTQLDSLHLLFPKNIPLRRQADSLLRTIEAVEYRQSIVFLQEELTKQQSAVDSLRGKFILQKDEKYQTEGSFVHKTQENNTTAARNGLTAYVLENGELHFTATIVGQSLCNFDALHIAAGDVFVETRPVAEDGAFNRHYNDGIYNRQSVTFRDENDAAALIANNVEKNVKVNTLGKCKTVINMNNAEKQAFKDTYLFAQALSESHRLQKEISKAKRMIERLEI